MKKKFLSLVLGICLSIVSLFSFTGCSLVKTDDEAVNSEIVLKIGNTTLSKSDIISAFSTYYQNNGSYFAYYGEDVIEESFYQWAIVRQMLNDMSFSALYDAENNKNGLIYYTEDDAKEVWENVQSYLYNQVSSYEKNRYELAGYEEADYPIWIRTSSSNDTNTVFEPYKKPEIKIDDDRKNHVTKKLTEEQVKAKVDELKQFVFEYVSETDEDGNETRVQIDETDYLVGARNQAYADYISMLVSSSKADGTNLDGNTCLENEIVNIYEAYYNSKITSNFQSYFLNEYLTNHGGLGDNDALSDAIIVKAFLEEYYTQRQVNSSEAGYIETITDSKGAPLILYSYNGQNYFFSVQHILIKFTDKLTEQVKALEGYSTSSNDYDEIISNLYKENRNNLAETYNNAMLTTINEKNNFDSIEIVGDYYFYDETMKDVYDVENEIYNGFIKLEIVNTESEDGESTVSYKDKQGNTEYDVDAVQYLATKQDVLKAYDVNFEAWKGIVKDYYDKILASTTKEEATKIKEDAIEAHPDMEYVFDTVDNMKDSYELEDIYNKVASYLFVELQWVYSTDTLGNEFSNKVGYIISNYPDENGSWVPDFANGSREIISKIESGEINIAEAIESGKVSSMLNTIVSDYGYHIIKLENVYESDSSIADLDVLINSLVNDGYPISYDTSTPEGKHFVEEIAKFMKEVYVASASNQTLYDCFFDQIYEQLVGTSSSSGTYFVGLEYQWLSDYHKNGQIEYINKMGYSDLMSSIM